MVLRRAWVPVVAALLAGGAAYALSSTLPNAYTAESAIVVSSGGHGGDPGHADEADKLATTYADLIPLDQGILTAVAQQINSTAGDVKSHVTAVNDTGTAVVRLRYLGSSAAQSQAGADALASAVLSASNSQTGNGTAIVPSSVSLLRMADSPNTGGRGPLSSGAVPAGVILGFVLGVVIVIAWGRADPRVENADVLEEISGCPSTAVDRASLASLGALLFRWQALSESRSPKVTLFSVARGLDKASARAAERLRTATHVDQVAGVSVDAARGQVGAAAPIQIVVGGAPGGATAAELAALQSDIVVIVAGPRTRIADLRSSVALLNGLGIRPAWSLLAADRGRRRG